MPKIGFPSEPDHKKIVVHGLVDNCDVTMKQIKDAHDTFGADAFGMKGKWVRKKPKPVNENCVAVPQCIAIRHKSDIKC